MTPLTEVSNFDATVGSYDTTDKVQGGPNGTANVPLQNLANRSRWLKDEVAAILQALGLLAPLASPALTGAPTAPTPAAGDNSTKLATTGFVATAIAPLASTALVNATVAAAVAPLAPTASPAFTGAPTAPTPAAGDNSTKLATTAFVEGAIGAIPATPPTHSGTAAAGWRWDPRDGWLEQWGESDVAISTEGNYSITYPVPFTTCYGVLGQALDPGNQTDSTHLQRGAYSATTASFRAQDNAGSNAANAAGIAWRAWGVSATNPGGS